MVCISILKIALYFTSFICLIANPVADAIGAVTALISALVLTSFIVTRFFYLKNYNLNERVQLFLKDEYNSGLNDQSHDGSVLI